MRDFYRLLYWIEKIGPGERSIVEVSRNSRKAHEIVDRLVELGLVRVRRKGKMYLISLTDRGVEIYNSIQSIKRRLGLPADVNVVSTGFRERPVVSSIAPRNEAASPGGENDVDEGGLPSFARDNPWLSVLIERGRRRVGV